MVASAERTALIIGATSDLAKAIALILSREGYTLGLAARSPKALEREARDIEVRFGVRPTLYQCDVVQEDFGISLVEKLNPLPHLAICTIGDLGNHKGEESDPVAASKTMVANYTGPALLMGTLANLFEKRGSGILVGISSVVGDRGRAFNYIYGSAKAGFSTYLSGLRNRLESRGVHVITVKPGFMQTRMTAGLDLPPFLTASPEKAALGVVKGIKKKRDIIYVFPIWRLIMTIICLIPEKIFKRMSL